MKGTLMNFNPKNHLITIKTKQGEQPYLPVAWRLAWFRLECSQGTITTELVSHDPDRMTEAKERVWNKNRNAYDERIVTAPGFAVFKAVVTDGKGGSASAYASERAAAFADY